MLWRLFKTAIFSIVVPGTVGVLGPQWVKSRSSELPLALRGLGLALCLVGVAIYLWCAWDFAAKGLGTPAPIDAPCLLVVKGLYRFTRNPMYAGVSAMILGQAIYYGSFSIVVYLLAIVLAFYLFVRFYEEPTLRRLFGEQYDEYCREVPRWLFRFASRDLGALVGLAVAVFLLHTLTNGKYGFHRDELLTLNNARHLAWGYVVYPPMTPFLGRVELELFGTSLRGFRFFAALSQGLVVLLTGLAARELGGKREAQLVAALAAGIAGPALVSGWFLSYTSFDYLCWVLVAYFVIRLLKSDDPRWWLAIGGAIGLGMMAKYSMAFLALGVAGGVLLTPARRYLKSPWFWCGAGVALVIVLPNMVWQMRHQFVSLECLKTIHARDIRWGWTDYFLPNQLWKCANPVTVPLWCAGLWYLFAAPDGKRYRMLGWMYVIPLLAFLVARGRDYYLAPAYPMLLAAGAVWGERWLSSLSTRSALIARRTTWRALAVSGLMTAAMTLPVAPLNSAWWRVADSMNGGNFNMQIGWPELAETAAKIRDTLPVQEQARLGILASDEGENGAVNLYGPGYGLPRAISGMNSNWFRGYGDPPPQTVIVVGEDRDFVDHNFASCELAGHLANRYGIRNATIGGYNDVFVCRKPRQAWPEFWKHFRYYG
ncbi:MAG TPA: glycosyltransferase family 39 protein [Candidatus Acidoferrum sp.]